MFKDGRSGSRAAWTHAVSDVSGLTGSEKVVSEGADGLEAEKESEEEPLKFSSNGGSRRQMGSTALIIGNPDLLTIPGVGPRNLMKLVEKGIGGVAELKQLYRDKVFFT